MAYNLSVTEAFTLRGTDGKPVRFVKGQIITDQFIVASVLASAQAHHVVKVMAPKVIPVQPERASFKGSK